MSIQHVRTRTERATATPPFWRMMKRWLATARQRAVLARLTDHELRDIGLTRAQARREAGRWFWDL